MTVLPRRASAQSVNPGAGRRNAPLFPKGRVLQDADVANARAAIGDPPYARDLLIEYLHRIQDREGCLPAGHLHGLAELMRLSMAEVYEVATFYAHFDVVPDGAQRPEPMTVRVCDSLSCALAGGEKLCSDLQKANLPNARVVPAPCLGACHHAPAVMVGKRRIEPATVESVGVAVRAQTATPEPIAFEPLDAYLASGGYTVLRDCLAGRRTRDQVIASVSDSALRGLGGAGFPTGRKWSLVRAQPGPRLMAVNGDEGEPGTFKDRHYLETEPHAVLEGILIAAWAVEATDVYIYMRDEYPTVLNLLADKIPKLVTAGLVPHSRIHVRRGAGAYICGEESAMIESIEGKRGLPRHRPPYVAEVGLFGRPTLVNNIETLRWVPKIVAEGPAWFAARGKNGAKGLRTYSVSGRVAKPDIVLTDAGSTARDLIAACGGMAEGHTLKGFLPGGASGGILPASLQDEPLEFGRLEQYGSFVGSHAVVILSHADDMKAVAANLMRFFAHESCGQCTPCRAGTEKLVALFAAGRWEVDLLGDLAQVMADASICGLGQAAANPVKSVLRWFPEDVR